MPLRGPRGEAGENAYIEISKFPHEFPNDRIGLISDNRDAQAAMLLLGVLDQVTKKRHPSDTTSICVVETHPSHWLMCAHIWENPDPSETGFMIVSFPKALFSFEQVRAAMAAYLSESTRIEARPIQSPGTSN